MKIKFDNPPINELVIATYFSPSLADLRAEHIGLFWSSIQKSFPRSQNAVPIGGTDIIGLGPGDIFPLPRFWFISEDDTTLIQIQKNAFLFNWRKKESDYPHFENVKEQFDKYFLEFEKFLKDFVGIDKVYIDHCELTYVNLIRPCELFQGIKDIKKIIPSITFPNTGLEEPTHIHTKTIYKKDKDMQLRVTIEDRVLKEDKGEQNPILYFELRSSGKLAEPLKNEADRWFEKAHDVIGESFLKMVSADAQNFWKVREP